MNNSHNVFISHLGKDDDKLQRLKQRLKDFGYDVRNGSVDSTKHTTGKLPSRSKILQKLDAGIAWAGTFICLIGTDTHTSPWVNYEIRRAHLDGKKIVGIYAHGASNAVELPEAYKVYGGPPIGWNSLDKLGRIMSGKEVPPENPDGTPAGPIYNIIRVKC